MGGGFINFFTHDTYSFFGSGLKLINHSKELFAFGTPLFLFLLKNFKFHFFIII